MKPKAYLKKYKIRQYQAAKSIRLNYPAFNHKLLGKRRWTPEEAKAWEVWTKGMVSRMDVLYPNE